jgi:uncharacterized protein (DUF1499 family)
VNLGRAGRAIVIGVAALALAGLATVIAGSAMGLFAGSRPGDLGLHDGKLRGGDWRPNWVSSQAPAGDATHHIAPLSFSGDAAAAWKALEEIVRAMPRVTVVTRDSRYLHAEFSSRLLGFVDDTEFALDAPAGVIQVRSSARLGVRDFNVNRDRVEVLRAQLSKGR